MPKDGWLRKAYHQMHPLAFDLASCLRGAKNRGTIRESITKSWVSASAIDTEIVTLFAKVSLQRSPSSLLRAIDARAPVCLGRR